MEVITNDLISDLSQVEGKNLGSLYMPTHRVGREMQQDPIRLKNLFTRTQERLASRGLRRPEIDALLEPVDSLLSNSDFWQHQSDGLVLFISPIFFSYYRLPIKFEELLVIGERFHLKPLYPLLSGDGQFYLLALSQKQIRLLHGSRFSIDEVNLENVPTSLREALWFDDPEKQLQFHTRTATPGSRGERASIFHGHSADEDRSKNELLRYFQSVDKGLMTLLGEEHYPLLLAGVDYLLPIYKEANNYPYLVESYLEGNPDDLSINELHQRAWGVLESLFQADQRRAREHFMSLINSGSTQASMDVKAIVPAAYYGQVKTLFVALDTQLWGSFDSQKGTVSQHQEFHPGDHDLLDLAAVQTLLNGGLVYALEPNEIPGESFIAAIYRYSLEE